MTDVTASGDSQGIGKGWRAVLILAAAIETLSGLSDLPILFGNLDEVPGPGLGGSIITLCIALHPMAAIAALALALLGRIRAALLAMAAVILTMWLSFLPSVAMHGLEFEGSHVAVLHMLFEIIVAPVIALVVAMLALHDERPLIALVLAVLPTFVAVAGTVAFAISVAVHDF